MLSLYGSNSLSTNHLPAGHSKSNRPLVGTKSHISLTLCGQHIGHYRLANANSSCDCSDRHASERNDLGDLVGGKRSAAETLTLGTSASDSGVNPFGNEVPFKLGKGSEDPKHEPTLRRGGVNPLFMGGKINTALFEFVECLDQM